MSKYIKILTMIIIYIVITLISKSVYAAEGITNKDTVRLREKASTNSATVRLIPIDENVEIISEEGDWYKVEYTDDTGKYTGYIRNDMLTVEGKKENNNSKDTKSENTTSTDDTRTTEESKNETSENDATTNETSTNETKNEATVKKTDSNNISEEVATNKTQEESTSNENTDNSQTIQENSKLKIKNKIDIKILPLINSSNIGTINEATEITITEIVGKWCYIETDKQSGWTMSSKIEKAEEETATATKEEEKQENEENKTETTKLYVSATTVNLREKASSSSKIVKQLSINTEVTLLEKVDSTWSRVEVSGDTGYVSSEYLSDKKTEVTSRGSDETRNSSKENKEEKTTSSDDTSSNNKDTTKSSSSSDTISNNKDTSKSSTNTKNEDKSNSSSTKTTGEDVVAYAKSFIGTKYVHGGNTPSTGFDCSGFTKYVYNHFGYSISRTSSAQRGNGIAVSKSKLKAGDIVCFNGHVGIYISNNNFIHAENPANGVTISSLNESYYKRNYITARRIIY